MTNVGRPFRYFVTVGAQMPFDRLVCAVDQWLSSSSTGCYEVFAQIGSAEYQPQSFNWVEFLDPPGFRRRIAWCDAIVAHAGMGSIISALQYGKPILVMPRRSSFRETRNDHQVATAERFHALGRLVVAMNETEIPAALAVLRQHQAAQQITSFASPDLLEAIRTFIHSE